MLTDKEFNWWASILGCYFDLEDVCNEDELLNKIRASACRHPTEGLEEIVQNIFKQAFLNSDIL
jgi:hypothetical protein